MNFSGWMNSVPIVLAAAVFVLGVSTIFMRRKAVWSLIGQVTALKAVAATALLLSQYKLAGAGDLAMISLVAVGLVPMAGLAGLVVLHRCGRFGGTLDYDEEDSLRN
jgi:NADH:ubiquinone oxidoreductase subunit K